MEPISKAIILGMAASGQTISRNTGVSIALVIAIMGATAWVTKSITSTDLRLSGLETTVTEIREQQTEILDVLQNTNQSLLIEDAIHNILFVEELD